MDASLLKTIVAVMDAGGNQTRAGIALGDISQSAVSQRLAAATDRYGEIFVQGSKRTELTRIGRRLYECGKALLLLEEEIAGRQTPKVERETLSIGYSRTHLALVAAAISYVIKPRSGLAVCTVEIDADGVKGLLRTGQIDVGVTYPPVAKPFWLEEKPIGKLPLALVVSTSHRLAKRSQISASELRDEPLALLRATTAVRKAIDKYFGRRKPRHVVLEADAATALLALARYGVATILPAFPQDEAFKVIPLSHPPVKTTSLLWKKTDHPKQSALLFADALEEAAAETLKDVAIKT